MNNRNAIVSKAKEYYYSAPEGSGYRKDNAVFEAAMILGLLEKISNEEFEIMEHMI